MATSPYPTYPQVAVGAIVCKGDSVLLVKRNQAPGEGLWAIPGGRIELGETLQEAAEREIKEETGIIIRAGEPVYTFEVIQRDEEGRIRFHYVIIDLLAEYIGGELRPGDDASEARWVTPQDLEILPVSRSTLKLLREKIWRSEQ
ncbi:MAG: NUDIX domain-containing protein [Nitrospinota bacterium]|nr:MAG: NUDIX domain-containing protein [Nitrospinota bacterium]